MGECHHNKYFKSTLKTVYVSNYKGHEKILPYPMFYVECKVCGQRTAPCLTVQEAIERACVDLFHIEKDY